jgi:hypothetical protein
MSAVGYINITYLSGAQSGTTEDVLITIAETLVAEGFAKLTSDEPGNMDLVFDPVLALDV